MTRLYLVHNQEELYFSLMKDLGDLEFRDAAIYSSASKSGYYVKYPPPHSRAFYLDTVECLLSDALNDDAILAAIQTLIFIWVQHPFRDGNGRFGRCLSNFILKFAFGNSVYVDFKDMLKKSFGQTMVNINKARFYDVWSPLVLDIGREIITSRKKSAR